MTTNEESRDYTFSDGDLKQRAASLVLTITEDAEQFDSEALWRLVGKRDWNGRRVLIVRGRTLSASAGDGSTPGRDWLMRQW